MTVKIIYSTKHGDEVHTIESSHSQGEKATEQLQKAKEKLFPKVVTRK